MIRTLLKPLSFIPAILLMVMIYRFSAQPAEVSSQLSYKVSYKIVEAADYVFETNLDYWQMDEWANRIHVVTRKLAHMTEYFALAIAVSFPLYVYGVHGIWLMLLAGMICVGFACGDEYHQSFVAGRSPSYRDVAIDSFGVFWGIVLVRIIGWTGRKTIFRPRKKREKAAKTKSGFFHKKKEEEPQPITYDRNYYMNPPQEYPPQGGFAAQNPYPPQDGFAAQNPYPQQYGYGFEQQPPYNESFTQNEPDFPEDSQPSVPDEKTESLLHKKLSEGPVLHLKKGLKLSEGHHPGEYDPQDPFEDWLDDYFPEEDSISERK